MRWFLVLALVACGSSPEKKPTPPVAPPPAAPAPTPAAHVDPLDEVTPLDPEIKTGHLKNGLTYFVMKHGKPEQRASLWLAVNAGSVLEDDDQRGLAHFTEHMAFNGTKRFPKQEIVSFIEKAGMDFGADLNAYTAFDQTVYQLTVPTDKHELLVKGVDVLRDWAGDITFDPGEIEKERGVVLEEWRLSRGAFARINDKQWPVMFAGSKYADRLPIGLPEIIKTAKREQFVRYYKDWYRPDNMAVIAIGDFDPAEMEQMIQKQFGDLANPEKERPRTQIPVPHDQPTAVTIATDAELPVTQIQIVDKYDHRRETTAGDYRRFLIENLYNAMLGDRFQELSQEPDAPFVFAASGTADTVRADDMFFRSAQAKDGKVKETLALLARESTRADTFGFTQSELDRARRDAIATTEKQASEWDKTPDPDLCDELTRYFFTAEQMPGRVRELAFTRQMLPSVTLAEVNAMAKQWASDKGRVIAISAPAKSKLPSEADVLKIYTDAASQKLEPWKDEGADKPLLAQKPTPGKIVDEKRDDKLNALVWTLSNGARVVVKPTTFANDEILMDGWSKGGTSQLSDTDYEQVRWFGLISSMGTGELSSTTLDKVLSGHVVNVSAGYSELATTVVGSTRPADLETMLQVAYLRMTSPRKDMKAFATWKHDQAEWIEHRNAMPENQFWEEMAKVQTGNHPRHRPETLKQLEAVNVDKALAVFKKQYSDFSGFTFVFVGNIDPEALKPLVATYLASLPATHKKTMWKDIGVNWAQGPLTKKIVAGTEPKSHVAITYGGPDKWTIESARDAVILSKILEIRLREVLREDLGGVYGVGVNAGLEREPKPRHTFEVSFTCDPANVDKLQAATLAEIAQIAKAGIGDDYLAKVREQLRREHETEVKENAYWIGMIHEVYWFDDDFAKLANIDAAIARVTSDNVKAAASHFFDPKKLVVGIMVPKK
ncbi:MAG: insulinase family protein [Kofleriaceae bacterium]